MKTGTTDATIMVPMQLERYQVFEEDRIVQLWGHVGDYGVCIYKKLDAHQTALDLIASLAGEKT